MLLLTVDAIIRPFLRLAHVLFSRFDHGMKKTALLILIGGQPEFCIDTTCRVFDKRFGRVLPLDQVVAEFFPSRTNCRKAPSGIGRPVK